MHTPCTAVPLRVVTESAAEDGTWQPVMTWTWENLTVNSTVRTRAAPGCTPPAMERITLSPYPASPVCRLPLILACRHPGAMSPVTVSWVGGPTYTCFPITCACDAQLALGLLLLLRQLKRVCAPLPAVLKPGCTSTRLD